MTITSKFNTFCRNCRCEIKAGTQVSWYRGVQGVTHVSTLACDTAKAARPAPAPTGVTVNGSQIVAFLTAARERGLKFPKVQFLAPGGGELRLSLAGSTSKYPGAVQVKLSGEWIGRVEANGNVAGPLSRKPELVEALTVIANDPATAAKTYGTMTGNCSFCSKQLTDAGSVEVGYGPVCAKKYGLPHKPQGTSKVATLAQLDSGADVDETAYDVDPDPVLTKGDVSDLVAKIGAAFVAGEIDVTRLTLAANAAAEMMAVAA